ncbi:MAG: hypothetical protein U0790_21015 [Isosphaeraceae bacterium]
MSTQTLKPLAVHHHSAAELAATLEFLKRTRAELRQLRRVLAWKDRLQVHDVNRDVFEVVDLGYDHPDIVAVLDHLNAAFDPRTIHLPAPAEYKEFNLGRCRPWAEDRVM